MSKWKVALESQGEYSWLTTITSLEAIANDFVPLVEGQTASYTFGSKKGPETAVEVSNATLTIQTQDEPLVYDLAELLDEGDVNAFTLPSIEGRELRSAPAVTVVQEWEGFVTFVGNA